MPSDTPIPPPGDDFLAWRRRHPQAADELIRIVNHLAALELVLAVPGQNTRGLTCIVHSQTNAKLVLPFKFDAPIANSSATAASASTQLNLLLEQLRRIDFNPRA